MAHQSHSKGMNGQFTYSSRPLKPAAMDLKLT